MGDIYCPICREPWDLYTLHEEVAERHPDKPWVVNGRTDQSIYAIYFDEVRAEFRTKGCGVFSWATACTPPDGEGRSAALDAIYELAGDDIDGAIADIEDFLYAGGEL